MESTERLEQRVADLEKKVAALEKTVGTVFMGGSLAEQVKALQKDTKDLGRFGG